MKKRFLLVILIFLAGCAPWMKVGGAYKDTESNFSVELPQGWMRLNTTKYLLITRDGPILQRIIIERDNIDEPLKYTKKKLHENMLPQEVAEVIIDDISSSGALLNFDLIENVPVTICGRSGFKIVFTHKNREGLNFKSIHSGFMARKYVYSIRYTAPIRHYFQKDIDTFEKVLGSFELLEAP